MQGKNLDTHARHPEKKTNKVQGFNNQIQHLYTPFRLVNHHKEKPIKSPQIKRPAGAEFIRN
jgi:hypothetical protein